MRHSARLWSSTLRLTELLLSSSHSRHSVRRARVRSMLTARPAGTIQQPRRSKKASDPPSVLRPPKRDTMEFVSPCPPSALDAFVQGQVYSSRMVSQMTCQTVRLLENDPDQVIPGLPYRIDGQRGMAHARTYRPSIFKVATRFIQRDPGGRKASQRP